MLGLTNLAASAYMAVFVLFAVTPGPMGLSKEGFGLLIASGAFGGVLGSWLAPHAERALGRSRSLAIIAATFGTSILVPALTAGAVANVAAGITMGVGSVVWNVITVSLRQRITPDRLLGRMNAAYRLLGWGTMPVGAALGGAVAEVYGLRTTFVVAAALHLPMFAGFLVVRDGRIAAAEAATADE
jgi:MFS family permease